VLYNNSFISDKISETNPQTETTTRNPDKYPEHFPYSDVKIRTSRQNEAEIAERSKKAQEARAETQAQASIGRARALALKRKQAVETEAHKRAQELKEAHNKDIERMGTIENPQRSNDIKEFLAESIIIYGYEHSNTINTIMTLIKYYSKKGCYKNAIDLSERIIFLDLKISNYLDLPVSEKEKIIENYINNKLPLRLPISDIKFFIENYKKLKKNIRKRLIQ